MASIAIATTVLHPGPSITKWLDYHLRIGIKHFLVYMDDPSEKSIFEELCGDRPVTLLPGAQNSPSMTPESRTILRQMANLRHAITYLRDEGYEWLLHIDIDELLYEPVESVPHWSERKDVGHVHFTNHEALPLDPDSEGEVEDVEEDWFKSTYFRINNALGKGNGEFMAYGNGKSAVHLNSHSASTGNSAPTVEPAGPHSFSTSQGSTFHPPATESMILHYPNPFFSQWVKKFKHYSKFSGYWYDDKRYPVKVEFMLRSRDLVLEARETGDWREANEFFKSKCLSEEEREEGVREGRLKVWEPFGRIQQGYRDGREEEQGVL
jgi:hypothetical protein